MSRDADFIVFKGGIRLSRKDFDGDRIFRRHRELELQKQMVEFFEEISRR